MAENQVPEAVIIQQLQQDARSAFARREKLSRFDRCRFSQVLGGKMSVRKAWRVVQAYAAGYMPEVGNAISQLARAWLVLGNQKFDVIFGLVRAAAMVKNGLKSFVAKIKELVTLPLRELKERLCRVEVVKLDLCLVA